MAPEMSNAMASFPGRLFVCHLRQDDPKKCTALKLGRFGFVKVLHRLRDIPLGAVILDPFSERAFSPADRGRVERREGLDLDGVIAEVYLVLQKLAKGGDVRGFSVAGEGSGGEGTG